MLRSLQVIGERCLGSICCCCWSAAPPGRRVSFRSDGALDGTRCRRLHGGPRPRMPAQQLAVKLSTDRVERELHAIHQDSARPPAPPHTLDHHSCRRPPLGRRSRRTAAHRPGLQIQPALLPQPASPCVTARGAGHAALRATDHPRAPPRPRTPTIGSIGVRNAHRRN